jgi:trigger factor
MVSTEALSGLPGLYDQLLGMSKGETKEIDAVVPDDFEDENMRGKTVHYRVTVNEIKEEQLPELDDAFAQDVGEGFTTLAELRARIATDLRQRKEEQAERAFERKLVDALIAGATLEYPPVLVEREIDAMLDEQLGGNRAQLEAALRRSGSSLNTLRERFRPAAVDRVQRSLVLTKVAELEGLSVEASEVDAEIERLASGDPAQAERLRQALNDSATRDLIGRTVLTRKVYQRLKDIATGKEVPPPASPASTTEYNERSERAEAAETTPSTEASQS